MTDKAKEGLRADYIGASLSIGLNQEEAEKYTEALLEFDKDVEDTVLEIGLMLHMIPSPGACDAANKAIGKTEKEMEVICEEYQKEQSEEQG
ncbi:hypothetical protein KAR91_84955 [Candidatus Pacearchaeota archaeon]|nr:hypothetical protein [Candidatus Pacearchaeota archaeon]